MNSGGNWLLWRGQTFAGVLERLRVEDADGDLRNGLRPAAAFVIGG
jgi:hypothetical protein